MRILVVDDDDILVEVLKRSLSSQRHVVEVAEDGQIGWEYAQTGEYDLVLLDVNLPGLDGVSLCEKMRSQGYTTPILLMTAKNATQDRILGLDAGADDYLTKPLDLGELNARVRALSRRGEVAPTSVLDINGLILDPSSCEVSYQQQPIKLTAKEYSLLEIFLRNPARVFSRSQILDKIWTFDELPLEESVKAHIKGLRKKLKQAGVVDWIENVYGIGYRLNPQVAESEQAANSNCTSIEQKFNLEMEQTWLKYQDKMSERLKVLQQAVASVKQANLSSQLQHDAQQAAHKLAGVLGMFSRDVGTDIAREIETLLQDNLVLNTQQREQFIALVTDLDSLLALDQTSTSETIAETKFLLISADHQLSQKLQQLGMTQGLAWHQIDNITQAEIWLANNFAYVVVIDAEATTNQPEYLSLISKLNSRTPAIPTIVLSATNSLDNRLTTIRMGASSFLAKPVTPGKIWQTASKLIQQNQSAIASILIVDDDVVFLSSLRSILEPWGIKVSTLAESLHFWEILQATQPDLVILDVEMPKINGIELCQAIRSDPDRQELPVLFLTARQDVKTIQQIFEIGGDDYIAKPVVGAELIARINNRLDRSRLLHKLATQDPLTRLSNRTQSSRQIESLLQQAQKLNQPFCLAVLKITDLQQINFKYGHGIGDRILAQWGKLIRATSRNDDITGYWDNGDFMIGMPNLDKTQAKEHLSELLTSLRKQVFTAPESVEIAKQVQKTQPERFQVAFDCAVAEFTKDATTIHSLYQTCIQS
ncbi:multi-component transcriptional regulator [Pleurocapsa sp. CCALA 161]|uniref:response regulator n=1 Tax=Pleurocapsa sp. CCALA 161 TaxID=2107688 RepID=UPI000D07A063|nr:response regulator [Pleurocapsa sp. CCALA 161]PSB06361.1 multi-component transcriptional regulator [Pleurocapsa sp. CCALA 161]